MIFNYLMWRCETFSGTTSTTKVRTYWHKLANTFHIFNQKHEEPTKCYFVDLVHNGSGVGGILQIS